MKVTIPVWKSYEYVEAFLITQYKDGCVFKTKPIGYAHRDRPKGPEERYASLSTSLLRGKDTIELEVLLPY
jgi:hypothetical protein